jgi:HK97 family phage prohead protease
MTKLSIPKDREYRYIDSPDLRVEKREESGGHIVRGTAVKFNQLSRTIGWFREKFAPGAFDDCMDQDVVALFNHNINAILARTISKTLKIWQDDVGLHYEFEAPDNTAGRDLVVSLERKDVQHSSFGFTIQDEKWEEDEEAGEIRTVLKVKRLYDVSPVVFPAYPQSLSEVSKRSYDEWKNERTGGSSEEDQQKANMETEILEQELEVMKLNQ